MAVETFRYIDYYDNKDFLKENSKILLRKYKDDLVFYTSFDSVLDADYYSVSDTPITQGTPTIENWGVFGQFALLNNASIKYDKANFESLTEKGCVSFRVNPKFSNNFGYQEFLAEDNVTIPVFPKITNSNYRFGGGSLDLTGGYSKSITYDLSNLSNMVQAGSINFVIKFNYAGIPEQDVTIISLGGDNSENKIEIIHKTDGKLYGNIYDQSGALITSINFSWSADYNWREFELNFDFINNLNSFFIDGTLYGNTTDSGTRNISPGEITIGGTNTNHYVDDIGFFSSPRHTENYSPRKITVENETNVIAFASYDLGYNLDIGSNLLINSLTPINNDYYFKIKLDDTLIFSGDDITITLEEDDELIDISDKISALLDGTGVSSSVVDNRIRISSTEVGSKISIETPDNSNSLISLLGGVEESKFPNAPNEDVYLFQLFNEINNQNRISLIHSSESHLYIKMYDNSGTIKVDKDLGLWNNEFNTWYAFEINWNKTSAEIFIDGMLVDVFKTGFVRGNNTHAIIESSSVDDYGFDELIIYSEPQHTEDFTINQYALTPYPTYNPYIDINFGTGFRDEEVSGMEINCSANINYTVKVGNSWYYYYSGSWRIGDGSFSQTSTPSTLETKFTELYVSEDKEVIVRAYFHSDGFTEGWIDSIGIIIESSETEQAVIIGSIDLRTPVDLSTNFNVVITTDKETKEIDVSSLAEDKTAVTLDEIKSAINLANIEGLAPASDDGNGHLVLKTI